MLLTVLTHYTCLIYANHNQCSLCSLGYYLTTNYSCTACPTGCRQCLGANNFLACSTEYTLNSWVCQSCVSNCFSCNSNGCQQCQIGFFVDQFACTPAPTSVSPATPSAY